MKTHATGRSTAAAVIACCAAIPLQAAWQEFETFEGLAYGPLNGKGGWAASSEAFVTNAGSPDAFASLANKGPLSSYDYMRRQFIIPQRTTSTVFFSFLVTTNPVRAYFGVADRTAPAVETDPSANVRMDTGGQGGSKFELGVNDSGSYDGLRALNVGTWYGVWLVLRNAGPGSSDRYDVYQTTQLGVPGPGSLMLSNAEFQHASGSISSFCGLAQAQMPYGTSLAVWIDTIYVDYAGVNLGNPIPEPLDAAVRGVLITSLAGVVLRVRVPRRS